MMLRRVADQIDPFDAMAVAGVAVLTVGVAMIFVPAAFIVIGGLSMLYAIAASRGKS